MSELADCEPIRFRLETLRYFDVICDVFEERFVAGDHWNCSPRLEIRKSRRHQLFSLLADKALVPCQCLAKDSVVYVNFQLFNLNIVGRHKTPIVAL